MTSLAGVVAQLTGQEEGTSRGQDRTDGRGFPRRVDGDGGAERAGVSVDPAAAGVYGRFVADDGCGGVFAMGPSDA